MATFHVTWSIDLDADDHEGAARQALAIQRDPTSSATVFTVSDDASARDIDLDSPSPNGK